MGVQAGRGDPVKDIDVVCRDGFRLSAFGEVFAEVGQDSGDAVRVLLTRRFEGIIQPLTWHETPDRAADDPRLGGTIAQPGAGRKSKQRAPRQ